MGKEEKRWYWVKENGRTGGGQGIVAVIGWILSKPRHLGAFTRLYAASGWDSLVCHPHVLNLSVELLLLKPFSFFDLELFLECLCHLFLCCSSKTLTRLQAVIVSCRAFCCFVFVFLLGFAGIGVGCFCKGRYFPSWATAIALEVLEELARVHLVSFLSLLGI